MKDVLRIVIVAVFVFCGSTTEGMLGDGLYIVHHSSKYIKLSDISESLFNGMNKDELEYMSRLTQCYQEFVKHSNPISKLSSSIASAEAEFLSGINKESEFLDAGYKKLHDIVLSNTDVPKKFDSCLITIYASSPDTSFFRKLAEGYKELALSSEMADNFIKAAFWFRLLYASGEHSSYLEEYEDMCSKAKERAQ